MISIFIISLITGCKPDHQIVYENFKVISINNTATEMASCKLSLRGTSESFENKNGDIKISSYVRSPYEAFIIFVFPKDQFGVVELEEIEILKDDKLVKKIEVNKKQKFDNKTEYLEGEIPKIKEEDTSRASFMVRKINITHSHQKVLIKAKVLINDECHLKKWEFDIVPYKKEELRNTHIDTFLSV